MTPRPFLIGIGGPSCAGKGELSARLAAALAAPVVALDSYYRDLPGVPFEERARVNFDEPASLDEELIAAQLESLAAGRAIDKPTYDFAVHLRAPKVERIEPAAFVVVEGLFALYWEPVRRLYRARIYIDAADELCFARRLERDVRERNRSEASVRAQYAATVRPMSEKYIRPTRGVADLVVSGAAPLDAIAAQVLSAIKMWSA